MKLLPFGLLVQNARLAKGLSQKDLASQTKGAVSQPVLSAWETAAALPKLGDSRLVALAQALDVPVVRFQEALIATHESKTWNYTLEFKVSLADLDFLKEVAKGLGGTISSSLMLELLNGRNQLHHITSVPQEG